MDNSEKVKPQPHYLSAAQLLATYEAAGQGASARALLLKRRQKRMRWRRVCSRHA